MTRSELRELAEKATPGPWTYHAGANGTESDPIITFSHQALGQTAIIVGQPYWNPSDAVFIAAANPAAILKLLDELDRKDADLVTVKTALSDAAMEIRCAGPVAHRIRILKKEHSEQLAALKARIKEARMLITEMIAERVMAARVCSTVAQRDGYTASANELRYAISLLPEE